LALAVGLLAVLMLTSVVRQRYRARQARSRRSPTQPEQGTLVIGPAMVGGVVFGLGEMSWPGPLPTFDPYRRQREVITRSLPPRVGLRVAPELEHLPWEAVVLPATMPPRGRDKRACWRELRPLPTPARRRLPEPAPWWRRRHETCGVLAPASWLPLLSASLSQVEVLDRNLVDRTEGRPATLVVLGTPVQTSAGTRLQVQYERTGPLLIEPDDPRWYDHELVVVMGEPNEGPARVDAERESAADLRRCAADLAAAGAGSVLCLPSMPIDLTGAVLQKLDRHLRRVERDGWRALALTTEAVREQIHSGIPQRAPTSPETEKAEELALEVTVFVRPDRTT
jgi:hypothetical protein